MRSMRKILLLLLGVFTVMAFAACGSSISESSQQNDSSSAKTTETNKSDETKDSENKTDSIAASSDNDSNSDNTENDAEKSSAAVVYFSATGTTENIAQEIADTLDADIYEIVPAEEYTSDDLDYNNDSCRANKEMNDADSRPAIANDLSAVTGYDTIIIGHPIWWGTAPRIIQTFFESYDLSGKTVYTFCTSGSSGIEQSLNDLKGLYPDVDIVSGRRFDAGTDQSEISEWLDSIGVTANEQEKTMDSIFYAHIGDNTLEITAADNSSAKAFMDLLSENDVTVDMHDYSNFEKVGDIGTELPTNDENINTEAGDVILYQGTSITIYYDTNTWDFTRLGKINNISQQELKDILGDDDVTVTFSLN